MKDRQLLDVIKSLYNMLKKNNSNELGFELEDQVDFVFASHGLNHKEVAAIKGEDRVAELSERLQDILNGEHDFNGNESELDAVVAIAEELLTILKGAK
jgi:hypothetical protein